MNLLSANLIKLAFSKKKLPKITKYLVLAFVYYPFLLADFKQTGRGSDKKQASTAGDDVYPLF